MTGTTDNTALDPQRIIAELQRKLDDARAELAARNNAFSERIAYQAAANDVLKVMSASPGDPQPVFDLIVERARDLCGGYGSTVYQFDGTLIHWRAATGVSDDPSARQAVQAMYPMKPTREWPAGRAIIDRQVIHIKDFEADPWLTPAMRGLTVKSAVLVPLMRGDLPVGVVALGSRVLGGFSDAQIELLKTFADQAVIAIESAQLFSQVQQRSRELARSLDDLRIAQDRLVQTEKLASLGQLTAGIAHEIKNPLNFVNNFSGMSAELIGELRDIVSGLSIDPQTYADIRELTDMLSANLEKTVHHGKRADAIVKSMLLHSGQSSGEHRLSDINALVDESLNRAYYGERAETRGFTIKLEKSFDPAVGEVDLFPREISRALLNLISNSFYATTKRKETEGGDYEPVLLAATRNLGDRVEIRIRDNGSGIPAEVKEKMFDPFFTTKPPGEGTGLGLSITHDIIVKQHGGLIEVDTKLGEFAEVRLILPRTGALLSERQ
jgi:two-component system NtrC family sensor kinase